MKILTLTAVLWFSAVPPVQVPMEEETYIPPCRGGEEGYWQFLPRGDKAALLVSTEDSPNMEAVICYVTGLSKVKVTMHDGAM